MEPVFPGAIVPHSEDGCRHAADFDRVLLKAYDQNHNMDSHLFTRLYNEAVEEWVGELFYINGRSIPVVKASPMRAFSAYRHLLRDKFPQDEVPEDADDPERFPLPFANYMRGFPKVNKELQQQAYPIRNIGFLDETMKRRTAWTRYPKALIIPYTIDIWCKYESHMDYIYQALMGQFTPVAYHNVKSPFSDGTIIMPLKLIGDPVDNSDLETEDTEDRLLRMTVSVEVDAWMFYDIRQAPTFQIETKEGIVIPSGDDETSEDGETVFIQSDKLTPLAPLTLEEIAESTSAEVPTNQP